MSIYIHIPFCATICSYCDFSKMFYNKSIVNDYLIALEKEIDKRYKGEKINTIYIGGGTPSVLNIDELNKLFSIINKINKDIDIEFTFECNIENIDSDKLDFLYKKGVNRLSIGVQTFNDKFLTFLNRDHNSEMIIDKINYAKKIGFKNISIDLIYALSDQTIKDLELDLKKFLELDINHISTYSLIIEENTKLSIDKVNNIDEDLDYEMYKLIKETLKKNGYIHYETSNFAKPGYESKHNLVYWNNNKYYGFGLGSSGYIDNIRYDNTRSINKYLTGDFVLKVEDLDIKRIMSYHMILGLRKTKGVSKEDFKKRYNIDIYQAYDFNHLIKEKKLIDDGFNIYINDKYLYLANEILVNFI